MTFPSPNPNPEKAALRRQLRAVRRAIPARHRTAAGRAVERLALRHRLLAHKRNIGFYFPNADEVDSLPLLNRALWMGVRCHLPMVPPARSRKLWFTRLGDAPDWATNRFGIPEFGGQRSRMRASRLDILFVPLLGFDADGYRMGMGGGYYDASLAFLSRRRHWRRPRLIGLAFDAQGLRALPRDPWDHPLDAVLTESRLIRFATFQ